MFRVLERILGFSFVSAATLLTPRHYHWACFSFRGFVCTCAFYLAVFLITFATLKIIYIVLVIGLVQL